MSDWLSALAELGRRAEAGVLVTVADAQGSVPREAGTKMVVTGDGCLGTIGGGNLEFKAIALAREMLLDDTRGARLRRFPLGPSLGQCCGGVAVLLFEPLGAAAAAWVGRLLQLRRDNETAVLVTDTTSVGGAAKLIVTANGCFGSLNDRQLQAAAVAGAAELLDNAAPVGARFERSSALLFETVGRSDFHILLFGAGHVGKALVGVLSGLPCTLTWVDSRAGEFPRELPANVRVEVSDEPPWEVDDAPPGSYIVIMTHSHPLDQAICERALRRGDYAYCGLIGSASKRQRFRKRLRVNGVSDAALAGLSCPIGVDGITGKHPGEIAVAVAAEILQVRERRATVSVRPPARAEP